MDINEAIFGRHSVRRFRKKDISDDLLKEIIEAGIYAPSACNIQGWKYIVVRSNDRDLYYNEIISSAPILIFVVYKSNCCNVSGYKHKDYIQSAAASIQNILLKTYSLGLGACWICDLPENEILQRHFNVPDYYEVLACIALGYPADIEENSTSQALFHAESTNLSRKRKYQVEDVIYYEKFGQNKKTTKNDISLLEYSSGNVVRDYWIKCMLRVADPVLENCANGTLHEKMPIVSKDEKRSLKYGHLEALGRTVLGISAWIECEEINSEKQELKEKYRVLTRKSLENAVNPSSPDYMNWCDGDQPLVDTAFLLLGILQAKSQLWDKLSKNTQKNLLKEIKKTRKISPWRSNWILFSAMVETFIYVIEGEDAYNRSVIDYAISQFEAWYVGDGFYKDGDVFHFDYYESIVIHPFLVDISQRLPWLDSEKYIKRALRYSKILENLISKDGEYPLIGRSLCYRGGVFHILSQIAYRELYYLYPERNIHITPEEIRTSLTSVLNKNISDKNFDDNGWLVVGVHGNQIDMAEEYINTGSLYIFLSMFMVTGLTEDNEFWCSDKSNNYSSKIWRGANEKLDESLEGWISQ